MGHWDKHGNWAVPALWAIFGVLLFCIWFSHYFDFSDMCPIDEANRPALCAREWIGAIGGYIATIFAVVTIYFLYLQIAEQREQTDFTVGDALPTLDVLEDQDETEELVVRIVNWNRRAVLVRGVDLSGAGDGGAFVWSIKVDDHVVARGPAFSNFDPPIIIEGWEDRQTRPHWASIKLVLLGADGHLVSSWPPTTRVVGRLQILGERHLPLNLPGHLGLQA